MQRKSDLSTDVTKFPDNNSLLGYSIIVNDVWKTYRIPIDRHNKLREYVTNFLLRRNRGFTRLELFEGISFKVQEGETLGIMGENGSGKSTLLKLLARIIYPDKGVVSVSGKVSAFIELGAGFDMDFTAEENIFLYGAIMGLSRKKIKEKLSDIYEFAELEQFRLMKLRNFSTGMILRLAFATAIQMEPDILLIDEVISVGDEDFQKKCFEKMFEFKKNKKTIIYVSHALNTVKKICDNAMWLKEGKIASYGEVKDVVHDYEEYMQTKTKLRLEKEKQ